MPTNTPKSLIAAAFLLAPVASSNPTELIFWNVKEWRQVGPDKNLYLGGFTNVVFYDGSWTLSGCFHPSPAIISPNIFCPLGTTAFIAQGDIDGDGTNDQGSFWSVSEVNPATVVEPFRTDLFKIYSAPPSGIADLLRASEGDADAIFDVQDTSVVIWYNVLAGAIDDYEVTQFEALRPYDAGKSELERHYNDVPWGPYKFLLPGLLPSNVQGTPSDIVFAVDHLVTPDAYPGRGRIDQGWTMTNTDWAPDGDLEFDPRQFYDFQWFGLNAQNALQTDTLFFSMRSNQYQNGEGITRTENQPDNFVSGTVTGVACNTLTTDIDIDGVLEQGKIYQLNITSGRMDNEIEYPITVFGTGGGLASNEILTVNDISGGIVNGTVDAVVGNQVTTNRDLLACLAPNQTYRLRITSGALAGTEQFPISSWGVPASTDLDSVDPLALSPGDGFTLTPEAVPAVYAVQYVGRHFLEGDIDLSNLVPGGDYRIEFLTGELAGTTDRIRNWGFPTPFFLETERDFFGELQEGDTFTINLLELPANFISVGDTISFSQTFEDWVQDKYDAGEVNAVPGLILEEEYFITPTPELEVDSFLDDLLGDTVPLYAVAREDNIVFPPYPVQTPTGDRDEFIVGTFDNHYELGPFFFRPGDSLAGRLNLFRNIPAGQLTTDRLNYVMNFRVDFTDTYEGFALLGGLAAEAGFPFGTPSSERAPDFDLDRDGASNLLEYALGSDVADPLSKPTFQYALDEVLGSCTATLEKRPHTGSTLLYQFEYSTDLRAWTTIEEGDPIFEIVEDDEDELTVANSLADFPGQLPAPACFLRVRVSIVD